MLEAFSATGQGGSGRTVWASLRHRVTPLGSPRVCRVFDLGGSKRSVRLASTRARTGHWRQQSAAKTRRDNFRKAKGVTKPRGSGLAITHQCVTARPDPIARCSAYAAGQTRSGRRDTQPLERAGIVDVEAVLEVPPANLAEILGDLASAHTLRERGEAMLGGTANRRPAQKRPKRQARGDPAMQSLQRESKPSAALKTRGALPAATRPAPPKGAWASIQRAPTCACGGSCPRCQSAVSGLKISEPNDPAEREADAVADRVMRMAGVQSPAAPAEPVLQLKRATYEGEDDEEKLLQTKAESSSPAAQSSQGSSSARSSVHAALNAPGQPLAAETRAFFEPRFGHDFSGVRVHTGATAEQSA